MRYSLRIIFSIIFFTVILSNQAKAQEGRKATEDIPSEKSQYINFSIGSGSSIATDNTIKSGSGIYAQAEYVYNLSKWIGLRPYVGIISNSTDKDPNGNTDYKVNAHALMLGGKYRITFPIPIVAPYIDLGIGASIGSFETNTAVTNVKKSGVLLHIPFGMGLSIGRKTKVDLGFAFYAHSSVEQTIGAMKIGVSIPIKRKNVIN